MIQLVTLESSINAIGLKRLRFILRRLIDWENRKYNKTKSFVCCVDFFAFDLAKIKNVHIRKLRLVKQLENVETMKLALLIVLHIMRLYKHKHTYHFLPNHARRGLCICKRLYKFYGILRKATIQQQRVITKQKKTSKQYKKLRRISKPNDIENQQIQRTIT